MVEVELTLQRSKKGPKSEKDVLESEEWRTAIRWIDVFQQRCGIGRIRGRLKSAGKNGNRRYEIIYEEVI